MLELENLARHEKDRSGLVLLQEIVSWGQGEVVLCVRKAKTDSWRDEGAKRGETQNEAASTEAAG